MNKFESFRKSVESGFQKDRVSVKSIVAMIMFGAIIMVFVLFGLTSKTAGDGMGGGGGGSAGRVNNTLISVGDLRSESQRLEQMYAPMFGGNGMGDAQRQFLRQQALESLIMKELAAQTAKKEGILATDAEIQEVIVKEIPAFQKDGRFQRDVYYQLLEANHLKPVDFEQKIRQERQNMRARQLFEVAAAPLKFEVDKLKQMQESKLNVAFVRLDKELVIKAMKTSDADVKAKLGNADFAKKVEEYFKSNKPEFTSEAQARAQHILIKVDDKTSEAAAQAQIAEIQKRAQKEEFGKLASQVSQDTGSKVKNGDLGFFTKGKMVPEFENAVFAQKVGEVGQPVKTQFGYHLIKVLEKKEAHEQTLDEAKTTIAQKLIALDAYEGVVQSIEQALGKNDSAGLDAELKKLGMTWEETGFFDLNSDNIPKLQSLEATKAAFAVSDAKPLFPKVVRDGAEKFVVKFKAAKKEASAEGAKSGENVARERGSELFASWIEHAKKTAKIERNFDLVKDR